MATALRVPDLLGARAAAAPHHTALVVDAGAGLTYRDWERRSDAAGRGLAAAGVRAGDRVALYFDNRSWADFAVAYIAVHKAGGAAVPLSPRFAEAELAYVLAHADVALTICAPDLPPPTRPGRLAHIGELETGERPEHPREPAGACDLAEIVYTSGTTGRAKGVACSHAGLVAHDLPPDAGGPVSFAHAFPIGTNAGQECLRMPLRRTATAVALTTSDPEQLCAVVAAGRIQRLQIVPAMAQFIVESGAADRHDVSCVDRVTLSSAPVPPVLWERLAKAFPNASLWNAYALTEGGGARTAMCLDPARPGSVGRPVGRSEVRVVDEAGAQLGAGETGEIWLRRPGAPRREYFRDPAATAAIFAGDWLKSGDLGYRDDEGYLFIVDRKKDVIIRGGLNISSIEIEDALYGHPAVAQAAVFAMAHPVLGQDVAAAVVTREPTTARELQAFVRTLLAEHKVPRRIHFVDSLPRDDAGKVRKRELRERFAALPAPGAASPRSDLEAAVVAVWRDVLGLATVGVHDDFFALGGHSLAATQVGARLRDAFDVELPVTAVFEWPTVAELAAAVMDLSAQPSGR